MSAILLIAVPLLAAFISILVKKVSPYLLLLVSLFALVYPFFMDMSDVIIGGFDSPIGINLVVNKFALTSLIAVNGLFFLVVAVNIAQYKKLSSILLVALAGLNGLLLTGDLFNLFVFIEISGIAAYLITTTNKKPLQTFNYLVAGTVGSSLYLLGLIILYNMSGTLNMADMATFVEGNGMYTLFPFLLMFIGLGVEAKLLPFNSWVKGILGHSNNLSGAMIASVYATAIALVFGKLLAGVFQIEGTLALIIALVLGITILAGEAMAYASTKAREILLYSSIAQAGIVILLFTVGLGAWATFFAIANGVSKFILFGVVNRLTEEVGSDEMDQLKGSFVNNKLIGVSFTVAALSILGLPLFFGFVVKMNSLIGFFEPDFVSNLPGGNFIFPIIILVASVIEGVYFVKLLTKLWYKDSDVKVNFTPLFKYVVVVLAVALIVFGLFQGEVEELVASLINPGGVFIWN